MSTFPFEYRSPASAAEAVEILAADPEGTRPLGGGTWVVPEMNRRESRPRTVLDLRRAGIGGIEADGEGLRIGATCSYAALIDSPLVAERAPLLHAAAAGITGGRQVQVQGTIGGSLAAARPQSDAPAAVCALGATAVALGPEGERRLPVGELFAGAMRTTLSPAEILTAIELPASPGGARWGYYKLKRAAGSWPIATAAVLVGAGGARLVLGAVAETPLAVEVDDLLPGRLDDPGSLERAARRAGEAAAAAPWDDELAPGSYRASVAAPVALRAIRMAAEREGPE
ncbi:MAG: xanthine dehydrogenase family protein subunit M [Solirubrobacterales bacterium]